MSALARLTLTPAEEEALSKDISNILDYVGQVSAVTDGRRAPSAAAADGALLRNVMRDDIPTKTLGDRESLLNAFPKREGDFNVVRKILDKDAGAQ